MFATRRKKLSARRMYIWRAAYICTTRATPVYIARIYIRMCTHIHAHMRAHVCTYTYAYTHGLYRYIGAWGRRYGCARAFSQPQGTNHYFIFHFVYFNSGGETLTQRRRWTEGGNKRKNEQIGHRRNRCRNRAFALRLRERSLMIAAQCLLYSLGRRPLSFTTTTRNEHFRRVCAVSREDRRFCHPTVSASTDDHPFHSRSGHASSPCFVHGRKKSQFV